MKKFTNELSLPSRLKAYSMLAAATMAASSQAAIVYTDINDTTLSTNTSYFLDLDNNGVDDYELKWIVYPNSRGGLIVPGMGNQVLCSVSASTSYYPLVMNIGNMISASQNTWYGTSSYMGLAGIYTSTSGSVINKYYYGNWFGATDKYLGLRFMIGNDVHYGWARLDIDSACTYMIIKDFAYENTPNSGINAGAMGGVGISGTAFLENIKMYNANSTLHIDLNGVQISNAVLSITSINGQLILEEKLDSYEHAIDLGNIRGGLYLVTIRAKEGILTRKIIVE